MNTSISQSRRGRPAWSSAVIWLAAFLSPTAYFLLLVLASTFSFPRLPDTFVWLLFLLPVFALLICESVVWSRMRTVGGKVSAMFFTLLAMLLQCGILLVIVRAILVTRIGYVQ
jgi:hypothetical protein